MRIAFFTDAHLNGKHFKDCELALSLLAKSLKEQKPDIIIDGGDLFDTARIADKYKSLGDIQRLALDFFEQFKDTEVFLLEGNHSIAGAKKSALEFLKADKRDVIQSPIVLDLINGIKIGLMPWISKSAFYASNCVGLSQKESEQKYTQELYNMLGYFKDEFEGNVGLIFGHLELQGLKINAGYTVQAGSFTYTASSLEQTGARMINLGHIHSREGYYTGALFQHSFGESNNPSGYEVIDIDEAGEISVQYIELDTPKFYSIDIHTAKDLEFVWNDTDHYRLLFYSEEAYMNAEVPFLEKFVIEKRWKEETRQLRTDSDLSTEMSDEQLLKVYMEKTPIPEGITFKDLEQADLEVNA